MFVVSMKVLFVIGALCNNDNYLFHIEKKDWFLFFKKKKKKKKKGNHWGDKLSWYLKGPRICNQNPALAWGNFIKATLVTVEFNCPSRLTTITQLDYSCSSWNQVVLGKMVRYETNKLYSSLGHRFESLGMVAAGWSNHLSELLHSSIRSLLHLWC